MLYIRGSARLCGHIGLQSGEFEWHMWCMWSGLTAYIQLPVCVLCLTAREPCRKGMWCGCTSAVLGFRYHCDLRPQQSCRGLQRCLHARSASAGVAICPRVRIPPWLAVSNPASETTSLGAHACFCVIVPNSLSFRVRIKEQHGGQHTPAHTHAPLHWECAYGCCVWLQHTAVLASLLGPCCLSVHSCVHMCVGCTH